MLNEKIKNEIVKYLNSLAPRLWFTKLNASVMSEPGLPDIICVIDGTFFGIEVKRNDNKGVISNAQYVIKQKIKQAGGRVIFAAKVEDVKDYIMKHDELLLRSRNEVYSK